MEEDKEKFEEIKQHYEFITTGLKEKTKFIDISILEYLEKLIQITENLIAGYKELKTHYEIICDDLEEHNLIYTDTPEFEENYIPKSKVKEKIEEISGMNEIGDIEREIYNRNEYAIEILLELLED